MDKANADGSAGEEFGANKLRRSAEQISEAEKKVTVEPETCTQAGAEVVPGGAEGNAAAGQQIDVKTGEITSKITNRAQDEDQSEFQKAQEWVASDKNTAHLQDHPGNQATEEEKKNVFAEVLCHSAQDLASRTFIYRPGATLPDTARKDLDPGQKRFIQVVIPLEFFTVFNPAFPRRQLWGKGPYTIDSDIVAALVHQGLMEPLLHYVVPPGAFPYTERVLFGRANEHDSETWMTGMNMVEGLGISTRGESHLRGNSPNEDRSRLEKDTSGESVDGKAPDAREILVGIQIRRLKQQRTVVYSSVYQNEVHSRKWIHWDADKSEPFYEFEIVRAELLYPSTKEIQSVQHPMEFIGCHIRSSKREALTRKCSNERRIYGYLKLFCDALSLHSPIMHAATASAFTSPVLGAPFSLQTSAVGGVDVAKRRKIAYLHEHTFRFNLSMDPCLSYGLHLVSDRGVRREWRMSARLAAEAVYFENIEGRRFELSQSGVDPSGLNLYRFIEVLDPKMLDRKQMLSAGIPLPSGFFRVPHELSSLSSESVIVPWSDIAFGVDHLSIKGYIIPKVTSIFFIPRSGNAERESANAQTDDSTNAAEVDEEIPLYGESENEPSSNEDEEPSAERSEGTSDISLTRKKGEGARGDKN
ncbi:hypothetical protein CCYA_CCYA01G0279 [Cyanidiococcus yangmingshanensis]|nr:hypothetical protein CCYA_CCYA01G0279 [Cyanidiococcus yangmingshanensis]